MNAIDMDEHNVTKRRLNVKSSLSGYLPVMNSNDKTDSNNPGCNDTFVTFKIEDAMKTFRYILFVWVTGCEHIM